MQVPPEGGNTEFASMRAAYADLPAEQKRHLEGLVAIYDLAYSRELIDPTLMGEAQQRAPRASGCRMQQPGQRSQELLRRCLCVVYPRATG
jgi:alpha-ketoglutarate-dependent taurine dioxygenase